MKSLIKTLVNKKPNYFFYNMAIILFALTMVACKKENVTPIDDELATYTSWMFLDISKQIVNDVPRASSKPLDIDDDSQADFDIKYYVESNGNLSIALVGTNDNKVTKADNGVLREFNSGDLINSHTTTWSKSALIVYKQDDVIKSISPSLVITGIYFKKDGKMHYGWLKLKRGLSREISYAIYFDSAGYEDEENKAIEAGVFDPDLLVN